MLWYADQVIHCTLRPRLCLRAMAKWWLRKRICCHAHQKKKSIWIILIFIVTEILFKAKTEIQNLASNLNYISIFKPPLDVMVFTLKINWSTFVKRIQICTYLFFPFTSFWLPKSFFKTHVISWVIRPKIRSITCFSYVLMILLDC